MYMTSSLSKRKCVHLHCGGNKIIAKDGGKCLDCPDGTKASRNKTECISERPLSNLQVELEEETEIP